jgi:hypothetical protein
MSSPPFRGVPVTQRGIWNAQFSYIPCSSACVQARPPIQVYHQVRKSIWPISPDRPLIHPGIGRTWRKPSRGGLTVRSCGHASILHLTIYSNRVLVLHGSLLDISEIFVFESDRGTSPRREWLGSTIYWNKDLPMSVWAGLLSKGTLVRWQRERKERLTFWKSQDTAHSIGKQRCSYLDCLQSSGHFIRASEKKASFYFQNNFKRPWHSNSPSRKGLLICFQVCERSA